MLLLAVVLSAYGARATYLSVPYTAGSLRCNDFLEHTSRSSHVILTGCSVDLDGKLTIQSRRGGTNLNLAPVITAATKGEPIGLFVLLPNTDPAAVTTAPSLSGRIVRSDDQTRLAVARGSAISWRTTGAFSNRRIRQTAMSQPLRCWSDSRSAAPWRGDVGVVGGTTRMTMDRSPAQLLQMDRAARLHQSHTRPLALRNWLALAVDSTFRRH